MTDGEGSDTTRRVQANAAPVRIVVGASQESAGSVPFILLLGIGGSLASFLMLIGALDAPFRYRSDLIQVVLLATGVGVTLSATALLVASLKGRSRLIEINESNLHVRTIRGAVDIPLHDVLRITTNKDRRLVVFDVQGRKYIPILAPESADWASVAVKLNESLSLLRQSGRS